VYPSFMLGVDGTISGTSAVFPHETFEMLTAVENKDYDRALAIHERVAPVWRAIDYPDFPGRAKYAVTLTGRDIGVPRRPFRFPSGDAAREIEQAMAAAGFVAGRDGKGTPPMVPADAV
jgi:4-hydroxy-tetrahydrodipicolinate synthase